MLVSDVTEHLPSPSSGAWEPRLLLGSTLPLKTFQQRHEAAQGPERDFISPTSLLQHTMSIHRQGQWQQESNGFRFNLNKKSPKPQTGDLKSEGSDYKFFGLIEHAGRHGRSNMNHLRWQVLTGRRGGEASSRSGVPLFYSHQLALYA